MYVQCARNTTLKSYSHGRGSRWQSHWQEKHLTANMNTRVATGEEEAAIAQARKTTSDGEHEHASRYVCTICIIDVLHGFQSLRFRPVFLAHDLSAINVV